MNLEQNRWARRYQTALRNYLRPGPGLSLQPVRVLGGQAVTLGLEPLDLAGVHEQAIVRLGAAGGTGQVRRRMVLRAKRFFAEAIVPLERTHLAARRDDVRVAQLTRTLGRRKREAAVSARLLQRGIAQRRAAEMALKKGREHCAKLLQQSTRLQVRLRKLAHASLTTQENKRKRASHQLYDDIAQRLLGIHVRLLTLTRAIQSSTDSLSKRIGGTQRLVRTSAKRIGRYAYEFGSTDKA
jgi:hypothetical protein